MANKFKYGDHAFIVENGYRITEVMVGQNSAGFYRIIFLDTKTALNLPESRLHKTKEEAENEKSAIKEQIVEQERLKRQQQLPPKRVGFRSPYDWE